MNPGTLHHQLRSLKEELKANEAKARSTKADPRDAHEAEERLPFLKNKIAAMETDIELASAAQHQLTIALTNLRTVANSGRELGLSITETETALWRLNNHLGEPLKPATKAR